MTPITLPFTSPYLKVFPMASFVLRMPRSCVAAACIRKGEQRVFVKAQGFLLHIMQLLEYDGGTDDEYDRDGKLCYDQYFTERDTAAAHFEESFQHFGGLERGHE